MKTVATTATLHSVLASVHAANKSIGFVPTMGALHHGHLSLVARARAENDIVVVSIFVNPAQFGPAEDLSRYPRPIAQDQALLEAAGVDILFMPTVTEIYPSGASAATSVYVPALSEKFCGASRPGHFEGVCKVVARLFNLVGPTRAYFGEKDFQQLTIIKKMVADLFMPIEICPCPIVRDADGLAASSRNIYLSREERSEATTIFKALSMSQRQFLSGVRDAENLVQGLKIFVSENTQIRVDYCAVVDPKALREKESVEKGDRILFAGFLGNTRLIDNVEL